MVKEKVPVAKSQESLFERVSAMSPEMEAELGEGGVKASIEGFSRNDEAAVVGAALVPGTTRGHLVRQPAILEEMIVRAPDQVESYLKTREQAIQQLRAVALKSTKPTDWTLFKDRAGTVIAVMRDSGAVVIRKWLRISIFNHRPVVGGVAEPRLSTERVVDKDGNTTVVNIAEMWADGICEVTGEAVEDVAVALRDDDGFVGRGHRQDLKASCRTSLDTKVVRILSGLRKVSGEELAHAGVDLAKAYLGSGYGTSKERAARGVSSEGIESERKMMRHVLLSIVGGDQTAARDLLREITVYTPKGSNTPRSWESVDRMTQTFQFENAWKALAKHELAEGADLEALKRAAVAGGNVEREPGSDG